MSNVSRFLVLDQPLPGEEINLTREKKPERIYRAAKAPHWLVEEDEPDEETFVDQLRPGSKSHRQAVSAQWEADQHATKQERDRSYRPVAEPQIVFDPAAEQAGEEEQQESEEEEEPEVHEEFDLAKLDNLEVPEAEVAEEPESDTENGINLREQLKERARLKQLRQEQGGGSSPEAADNQEEVSDSESSGSESDSDFDGPARPRRMKPQFLTKRDRKKLQSRSRPDEEKAKLKKYQKMCDRERREESKRKLYAIVRYEDAKARGELNDGSDEELPPTDDDEDEEEQFEAWKLRELKRIKREKDALDAIEEERLTLEKRRGMTDKEIELDNEAHGVKNKNVVKPKMKFMQKYYHKGVFYQDDNLIQKKLMERNYMAPTREDKWINFESVPEVMRVKNFGLASQTKWTHLVNEDTTNMEDREEEDIFRTVMDQRRYRRGQQASQSLNRPSKFAGGSRKRPRASEYSRGSGRQSPGRPQDRRPSPPKDPA